jgi:hypothetical protein
LGFCTRRGKNSKMNTKSKRKGLHRGTLSMYTIVNRILLHTCFEFRLSLRFVRWLFQFECSWRLRSPQSGKGREWSGHWRKEFRLLNGTSRKNKQRRYLKHNRYWISASQFRCFSILAHDLKFNLIENCYLFGPEYSVSCGF